MGYCGGVAGLWWWLPGLFWLLVLGGVGLVVYAAVRRTAAGGGAAEEALRTLAGRYARGELEREQYLQMRADLEGRAPRP